MTTLRNILSLINKYDGISIHDKNGYVVYDGLFSDITPSRKKLIDELLDDEVGMIRPYNNFLIIAMK